MSSLSPEKQNGKERLLKWSKGILTAAGAILLFLVVSLSVSYLYTFICAAQGITDASKITELVNKNALLINIVVNVFVVMFLILFSMTKKGKPAERLKIRTINPAKVVGFILFGICLNVFLTLGFGLIPFPEALVEEQNQAFAPYYSSNILMSLISVGLVTGIAEELLFRSAVISPLRTAFGRIPALIISSVVFSLIHTSLIAKIYSLILGLIMGLFFLKYDSVVPAVLIHVSFNCTSFVLDILDNARLEFIVVICIISAILLVRIFIWLYVRYPGFSDILFDKSGRLRPDDPPAQLIYDRIRDLRENEEEIERKELEALNEDWENLRKRKKKGVTEPEAGTAASSEQVPGPMPEPAEETEDSAPHEAPEPEQDTCGLSGEQTEDAPEEKHDTDSKEGDSDDQTV